MRWQNCHVGLVQPERRQIDGEEISALRFQHGKADALQPLGQAIPAPRQLLAHVVEILGRLVEAVGDGGLQVGRRGEGEKLVHLGGDPQQRRRGADEADLPSRQRKNLAGAADLDGAVAHARNRDQRDMLAAIEGHVLPDLVADRDGVELLAEPRQQFEVFARIDHGGRIERIVEQHRLGLVIEDAAQHLLVQPPVRRLEPQQPRNAAGLADDRQVAVIDRLEADDFVAGLDHGENGRRQRLGAAGGHHHLGHRIEVQPVPAPIMGGDRLPQLRNAHHRRVLVVAVDRGVRGGAPDILRPGIVGKALAEIDGVVVARGLRHRLEDGDRKVGEDLVHGSHVSKNPWGASAAGLGLQPRRLPAQYAARQMLVVRQAPPPAPPATPSPSACRIGRRTPPACPWGPEWPPGRTTAAEPPRRPDRLRRRPHSARGHRPADSVPPPSPSRRLPASNRAPDGPPRVILPTTCFAGSRPASRAPKSPLARRKSSAANGLKGRQTWPKSPRSHSAVILSTDRFSAGSCLVMGQAPTGV